MNTSVDDGVIKFSSERMDGVPTLPKEWSALNHARTQLFDMGLIGCYASGIGYGNLSVRAAGNQFVITGSSTGGTRILQAAQYCLVESFSVDSNHLQYRGLLPASSEAMTHGAVYAANDAVSCVIHVHNRPMFDSLLCHTCLATACDIPYGTPAMARAVSRLVARQVHLPVVFAMAGHDEGVVAYGADVASVATHVMETFRRTLAP